MNKDQWQAGTETRRAILRGIVEGAVIQSIAPCYTCREDDGDAFILLRIRCVDGVERELWASVGRRDDDTILVECSAQPTLGSEENKDLGSLWVDVDADNDQQGYDRVWPSVQRTHEQLPMNSAAEHGES